jgi:hypothetical protein
MRRVQAEKNADVTEMGRKKIAIGQNRAAQMPQSADYAMLSVKLLVDRVFQAWFSCSNTAQMPLFCSGCTAKRAAKWEGD